jgi:hypothetical protein
MIYTMFLSMVLIQVFLMPHVMTASQSHVYYSLNQFYMGCFMGSAMVAANGIFYPMSAQLWILTSLILLTSVAAYKGQWFISDSQYLHDMIPHHSMAVVTSQKRVDSVDPFINSISGNIIRTQTDEIAQMKAHLGYK